MSVDHIETLIIGAGQSGLATAHHLQLSGHSCLVIDANERVGDGWRRQWDTLKLYSPARYDSIHGLPFPAPAWSFPGKEDVANYFETYAEHFDIPVRLNTRVDRLASHGDGYVATCGEDTIFADNVVVATGTFGRAPQVPEFADKLDPMILQMHSSEYRRSSQLRPGPVLVVGASHSGADVAYEVSVDHQTILCGRDTGQIPVRLTSPMFKVVFPIVLFVFRHVLSRRTPMGRKEMDEFRLHGGPALRVKRSDLKGRGVERVEERVVGVDGGRPVLAGGRVVDVANVVWCTGFKQAFDWIDLPIFDERGWPVELRGVVDAAPGLYFCGLGFQSAAASMLIAGVDRDSRHVAKHLVERMSDRESVASAA
jgi:putative flavoprotein involved in K+ transport